MRNDIPHNRLTRGRHEVSAASRVVASGHWACGKKVERLEKKLSLVASKKYAVAVSSGLSAIRLALLALDIKKGDGVILPAYSCVALANAILSVGAKPLPADVLPGEWNINPSSVEKQRRSKNHIKAVIAVHTFGFPARLEELK